MTIVLRPTPDLFDLAAWRRELEWLRAQPGDLFRRADAIAEAEDMVRLLEERSQKTPAEAL